jgi:hypothetical protein
MRKESWIAAAVVIGVAVGCASRPTATFEGGPVGASPAEPIADLIVIAEVGSSGQASYIQGVTARELRRGIYTGKRKHVGALGRQSRIKSTVKALETHEQIIPAGLSPVAEPAKFATAMGVGAALIVTAELPGPEFATFRAKLVDANSGETLWEGVASTPRDQAKNRVMTATCTEIAAQVIKSGLMQVHERAQ